MIRFLVFCAGLLMLLTTVAHVFGGGPEFLDVALASNLPTEGKAVYTVVWHFTTACLALFSVALLWSLTRASGERAIVTLICALSLAFGVLFFAIGMVRLGSPFVLLQWTVFFAITSLLAIALRLWPSRPQVSAESVLPGQFSHLPGADFADAYATEVPRRGLALDQARAILSVQPRWVAMLMALRNAVVAPFGLIRSTETLPRGFGQVGFFPVLSVEERRTVLGLDDRHLDFRLLVDVDGTGDSHRVVLTTLVRTHNWLGRVYMFGVKPFHRAIVIALLQRAAKVPGGQNRHQQGKDQDQKHHRVLQ
jgi:hypothetical protein